VILFVINFTNLFIADIPMEWRKQWSGKFYYFMYFLVVILFISTNQCKETNSHYNKRTMGMAVSVTAPGARFAKDILSFILKLL